MATTEARCIDCGWEGANMGRIYICPACRGKNVDYIWDEQCDHPLPLADEE